MFSEYVKPIGETADINWHRFGIKEADSLIKNLNKHLIQKNGKYYLQVATFIH